VIADQRRPWRYIAVLLSAVPAALLVLASIGGLTETNLVGIPVVPVYTLFGLPIDLIIRDIAMACTLGFALVGGVLLSRPSPTLGKLTSLSAVVWLIALVAQTIFTVSEVLALPISQSFDPVIIRSLLTQTTTGQVIMAQFALISIVALLGWVVLGKVTGWIVVLLAATAVFLPGLTGHSSMDGSHNGASIGLGIHLVFMAVWVGGLVALAWYVKTSSAIEPAVVSRFSVIAVVSVILIAESGLLNASMRLDGIAPYFTSTYGSILLAKISILILLIGYGWQHRQEISQLGASQAGSRIASVAVVELMWLGLVIGLAVALSRTASPAFAIDTDPIDLGSLAIISIALPAALLFAFPHIARRLSIGFFVRYPEIPAIVLVVGMYGASELMSTSLVPDVLLAAVVLALGLFFVASQWERRSSVSLVIVFIGWLANVYAQLQALNQSLTTGVFLVSLGIAGILVYVWWMPRTDRKVPDLPESVSAAK